MVGKQGINSSTIGRRNRNRILAVLMESPMHFSKLKRKMEMAATTLTSHLEVLLNEGRVKRQVEGRKIVYVVVEEKKDQTVLDMRKDCWNDLVLLLSHYSICLTKETKRKLMVALEDLKKSIEEKTQDVDRAAEMMGVPETPLDEQFVSSVFEIEREEKK